MLRHVRTCVLGNPPGTLKKLVIQAETPDVVEPATEPKPENESGAKGLADVPGSAPVLTNAVNRPSDSDKSIKAAMVEQWAIPFNWPGITR